MHTVFSNALILALPSFRAFHQLTLIGAKTLLAMHTLAALSGIRLSRDNGGD